MVGGVNHVVHHTAASVLAVDRPGIRVGVPEFILEAVAEYRCPVPGGTREQTFPVISTPPPQNPFLIPRRLERSVQPSGPKKIK